MVIHVLLPIWLLCRHASAYGMSIGISNSEALERAINGSPDLATKEIFRGPNISVPYTPDPEFIEGWKVSLSLKEDVLDKVDGGSHFAAAAITIVAPDSLLEAGGENGTVVKADGSWASCFAFYTPIEHGYYHPNDAKPGSTLARPCEGLLSDDCMRDMRGMKWDTVEDARTCRFTTMPQSCEGKLTQNAALELSKHAEGDDFSMNFNGSSPVLLSAHYPKDEGVKNTKEVYEKLRKSVFPVFMAWHPNTTGVLEKTGGVGKGQPPPQLMCLQVRDSGASRSSHIEFMALTVAIVIGLSWI